MDAASKPELKQSSSISVLYHSTSSHTKSGSSSIHLTLREKEVINTVRSEKKKKNITNQFNNSNYLSKLNQDPIPFILPFEKKREIQFEVSTQKKKNFYYSSYFFPHSSCLTKKKNNYSSQQVLKKKIVIFHYSSCPTHAKSGSAPIHLPPT